MTIEYLCLFVSWVDSFSSLQLHHLLHSLFPIQMLRWIRGSSRVEFIIFLIAWGILFGWRELDLPIFFSLTMSWASSCVCSSWNVFESNHFLLAHIPWMNESHDPGRPFKMAITTSTFFISSSTASSCSSFWIFTFFSLFSQIHLLIYVLPFK